MEVCPKYGRFCAERNHYTGLLLCYNRSCDYKEEEVKVILELKGTGEVRWKIPEKID